MRFAEGNKKRVPVRAERRDLKEIGITNVKHSRLICDLPCYSKPPKLQQDTMPGHEGTVASVDSCEHALAVPASPSLPSQAHNDPKHKINIHLEKT